MEIDKKAFLVLGTPNEKTKEKIRLRIRQILNGYKKCILGIAAKNDIAGIAYQYDLIGYKYLFFIYKSTSVSKIKAYETHFKSVYANELISTSADEKKDMESRPGDEAPFILYLLGKSKKRVF